MAADGKLALLPKETAEVLAARRAAPPRQSERRAALAAPPEKAMRRPRRRRQHDLANPKPRHRRGEIIRTPGPAAIRSSNASPTTAISSPPRPMFVSLQG
jgi:hypothetical protein